MSSNAKLKENLEALGETLDELVKMGVDHPDAEAARLGLLGIMGFAVVTMLAEIALRMPERENDGEQR